MQFSLSAEQRRLLDQMLDDSGVGQAADRIGPRTGAPDRAPLSFGQERLFLVDRLQPGSPMYVGTGALRLRGSLDPDILEHCFALLVERHEVLRTAIGESPETGEPEQRILGSDEVAVRVPVREVTHDELHRTVTELASEGFDLSRPPLLRAVLLKVSDAPEPEWTLVLSVHHIVVDGWSMGLLMAELGEAYAALSQGRTAGLPPLALQYADFAAWQRGTLEQGLLDKQLQYWRETLDGVPMVDVAADRPRPAQRSYAGGTVPLRLPASVVKGLRALTDEAQATLFMALVAGWSVVLGRWSGENDVVVGTPVAGRRRAELESTVGFFVNTLPLRVGLKPDDDFRALLRRTRDVCVDAYAHQDVSFERIVAEVPAERDVSGQTTLARHWLVLHNTPPLAFSVPGLEAELLPSLVGTVRCDLSVQLAPEEDGGLDGRLEYSTELFDRDTADRLAAALTSVLTAAAETPGGMVRELPVMPREEYEQAVSTLASERAVETEHADVVAWFEAQTDRTPDATAVIADGGGDAAGAVAGETLTYAELDGRANPGGAPPRRTGRRTRGPGGRLPGAGRRSRRRRARRPEGRCRTPAARPRVPGRAPGAARRRRRAADRADRAGARQALPGPGDGRGPRGRGHRAAGPPPRERALRVQAGRRPAVHLRLDRAPEGRRAHPRRSAEPSRRDAGGVRDRRRRPRGAEGADRLRRLAVGAAAARRVRCGRGAGPPRRPP
ncbi:hypothetical protein D9753_00420 [Streptomyces dangxiongensis]|uniref:Condensation domain-containing protein n=1 Tax=Streptomyces dangxiongensis TaxID=1442032 RepID=A0A3G2J8F0_9ACTN|nr:hypothetical protein D9753_00420 [Streptomyces dangxiongensis]